MKRSVSKIKNVVTVLLSGLLLMFGGCEIGLGAAVDTTRPVLKITYPPKGASIMGSFKLAGTVSDDVGVSEIKITLTNLDTNTTYIYNSKEGQVLVAEPEKAWSKGTTWQADIGKKESSRVAYNGWDIPDGDYNVTVETTDGYGWVKDTRSFSIDTTPPVFDVATLSSITDSGKNVFGHKISFSGYVKDASDLSKVYFNVFDDSKNEVYKSELPYKMTYEGIVIAEYSATVPSDSQKAILKTNFDKISGLTDS